MAIKFQGSQATGASYRLGSGIPLDERLVVSSYSDLFNTNTFLYINKENQLTSTKTAYPGMVVAVIEDVDPSKNGLYYLTMLPSTEEANWERISMPQLSEDVEGKLLTVVKINTGTDEVTGLPIYKYETQWADAPSGLPTMNENSVGKLLKVVKYALPPEVPGGETTYDYTAVWADAPTELPTITEADKGKALTVDYTTGEATWSTIDTSLVTEISTQMLFMYAEANALKPGMKYRITDYGVSVNDEYTVKINDINYGIGGNNELGVNFDIIATASSFNTLFDDVELVLKTTPNVTSTFDYSKYEAKYDLFGNTNGWKYKYLVNNAKGVIYYMKDQFGNEASYDFENIFYTNSSILGIAFYTFTGIRGDDLRKNVLQVINDVRIRYSKFELPGIMFELSNPTTKSIINDVELNNCKGIYIKDTILSNAKISNSSNITFTMYTLISSTDGQSNYTTYCPMFENLNICNNIGLYISCDDAEFIASYDTFGGFYVNNFNVLPSISLRSFSLRYLQSEITRIVTQGLNDSGIVKKCGLNAQNASWTTAVLGGSENALKMMLGSKDIMSNISGDYDPYIYDSIFSASKNLKPFDIFNAADDFGVLTPCTLEIPQFQSTATSVVELGI